MRQWGGLLRVASAGWWIEACLRAVEAHPRKNSAAGCICPSESISIAAERLQLDPWNAHI
ncbi:MAG: hypothetical protein CMJ39_01490 [Phycisphaerae bacterium]|nr:hypothetical protein [Phycisphaerae bacterium]